MKKGLAILIFLGIVLVAFFYMSPVTPSAVENPAETEDQHTQEPQNTNPDAEVDETLRQLQTGEVPPMQAILKLREIAENNPGHVKANYTLGVLSMQTGQYDKAIGRFETVLEQQPDNGQVWKLLAEAQMNSGDTTQARQSFEKALSLVDETTGEAFKKELSELNSIN